MSSAWSARIQALLRKRLGEVGVAPDLHNDDLAIAQICQELGVSRESVASELDEMRTQVATQILGNDRLPAGFLSLKPAMRRAMGRLDPLRTAALAQMAHTTTLEDRARQRRREAFLDLDLG